MSYVDRNQVWIRRNDAAKWESFRAVAQFIPDLTTDRSQWVILFAGVFTELIGLAKELAIPDEHRAVCFCSADATPNCIGGINWHNRQFFVEPPGEFISPFLPFHRTHAHINEIEFPAEVMCTGIWSDNNPSLIICGISDNICSNSWVPKGKAKRGVGSKLFRAFHMWLIRNSFRFFVFYSRSGRNFSPDFLSRAGSRKVEEWARVNGMSRVNPRGAGGSFCCAAHSPWPDWKHVEMPKNLIRSVPQIAEWQPGAFCLASATLASCITYTWINHRHARIARLVANSGLSEYSPRAIHFMGGLAKDFAEAERFANTFIGKGAERGILITPHLLDLAKVVSVTIMTGVRSKPLGMGTYWPSDGMSTLSGPFHWNNSRRDLYLQPPRPWVNSTLNMVTTQVPTIPVSYRSSTYLIRWERRSMSSPRTVDGLLALIHCPHAHPQNLR